jgi:hypothetical protein
VIRLRLLAALCAITTGVIGCGTVPPQMQLERQTGPVRYESGVSPTGMRIVLHCKGNSAFTSVCQLWTQGAAPQSAKNLMDIELRPFANEQQYLRTYIPVAAEDAIKHPKPSQDMPVLIDADVFVVRQAVANPAACVADKAYPDLLVACPASEKSTSNLVMFIRGLCDRCEFHPVVLRKVN